MICLMNNIKYTILLNSHIVYKLLHICVQIHRLKGIANHDTADVFPDTWNIIN